MFRRPVVFHDWMDGQGPPVVSAKGAFGLSAQPIEFLQRHIELSKNFEEQRWADFPSTMQWDSNGPSIAMRPAFVAARLAAPHETKRQRRALKLARRRASVL